MDLKKECFCWMTSPYSKHINLAKNKCLQKSKICTKVWNRKDESLTCTVSA